MAKARIEGPPERVTMTELTVAALQLAFTDDLDENIGNVSELVREAAAKGAKVVLPPELFEGPYFCRTEDEAPVRDRSAGRFAIRRCWRCASSPPSSKSTSRPASSRRTGRIIITASR